MKKAADSKVSTEHRGIHTGRSRTTLLEMAAVLLLVATSDLGYMGCRLLWGSEYQQLMNERFLDVCQTATAFDSNLLDSMFSSLRYVPIILFVIWRSGDGWSHFGLVNPAYSKDALLGLSLSLIIAAVDCFVHLLSKGQYPLPDFFPVAVPWNRTVLLLGQCCVIGFSEELWARAYLIPRLESVTGATWKSVLLSVVVFGFAHLCKGFVGVTASMISATVWGIAFCLTRRIWPVAISHAITDFVVSTHLGATIGL